MKKDYLLEIYKVEAEKYNKTRDIQWKINISIWTVLIVAIYAKSQHEFTLNDKNIFVQLLIYLGLFILHTIFIYNIHGSLKRSLTRMHNMAAHLLEQDESVKMKWLDFEKKIFYKKGSWEYWQLGITSFLIYIFYL